MGHFLNNLVPFMISRHDILTCGTVSAKLATKIWRNFPKTARFCDILTVSYKKILLIKWKYEFSRIIHLCKFFTLHGT